MNIFKYNDIKEFEQYYNSPSAYVRHLCACGGINELQLLECIVKIDSHEILIKDCPILICKKCDTQKLGNLVPQQIYNTYFEMKKRECSNCRLTSLNNKIFEFAKSKNFVYDCRDLNIPGLDIDLDPTHPEGFSCPVFFDKKVLNNFLLDDDYGLDLYSETQGVIGKKGTDGWEWEWLIKFGINTNNKVVIFLGDLHQISDDDKAVYWLKSYNIESDHTVVDSELYQSELNCKFSEPIIEKRLIKLRNAFFNKIKCSDNLDLHHLEVAVNEKTSEIEKPLNYTKAEIKNNIVLLDNMLNDAINISALRELYKKRVTPLPSNYTQLKTIKLLLGIISSKLTSEEANDLLSPLFNLKDLRDYFSHILPEDEVEKIKERIVHSYNLENFEEYEKLYKTLLKRLLRLYNYLNLSEF